MSAKLSNRFLFLVVGFLMFPSPFAIKAQNTSEKCKWDYVYGTELKQVVERQYNARTKSYDETRLVWKWVSRSRMKCVPTIVQNNPITSSRRNPFHPNTVRTAEGKLTPAAGYQWVNDDDPEDFRVEPKPGLVESELGKLRPAKGYRWVNTDDPNDFRVERIPRTRRTNR